MSDKAALAPLKRTNGSIQQIKHTLTPFLNLLDKYHNSEKTSQTFDKQQIVEAESAVAHAMGTLRYMAHRLKGEERGKDKNDPLRMELDKMRRTLVQVKRLRKPEMKTSSEEKMGSAASKRKSTKENDGTNGDIANISSGGKKLKK